MRRARTGPPGPVAGPRRLLARTSSAAETMALGSAIAAVLVAGDTVVLAGDLGAGKTTLTKGLAAALGVTDTVQSPTFTLLRTYAIPPATGAPPGRPSALIHADLFRLDNLSEVVDLAIGELLEEEAAAVVEWGDVAVPVLGRDLLVVSLSLGDEPEERMVSVDAAGSWERRLGELERVLGPWLLEQE